VTFGPEQAPSPLYAASSMPDRDWWAALWPDPAAVLERMGIIPGMRVLDLCCGDGYFTAALAKLAGDVCALDADPAMLRAAEVEAALQGVSLRRTVCGDAGAIGRLLREAFDYVLLANTLHGAPDKGKLARSVHAALGPMGKFGVINWLPLPREQTIVLGKRRGPATALRLSVEETRAMVEAEGFETVKTMSLPPWHYGVVFRRTE
jgi:SAM-dependent methyltransferase